MTAGKVVLGVIAMMTIATAQTIYMDSMPEWRLVHRVEPVYSKAARQNHIEGVVRFTARIGKDGRVEKLSLISGHPLLVESARNAVRQWIYRPELLNGKPVLVITKVEVEFRLHREKHESPFVTIASHP